MLDSKDIEDIPDESDIMALRPSLAQASITKKSIARKATERWEILLFISELGRIHTIMTGEFYSSSELALWNASRRAKSLFRSTGKNIDFGVRLKSVKH